MISKKLILKQGLSNIERVINIEIERACCEDRDYDYDRLVDARAMLDDIGSIIMEVIG